MPVRGRARGERCPAIGTDRRCHPACIADGVRRVEEQAGTAATRALVARIGRSTCRHADITSPYVQPRAGRRLPAGVAWRRAGCVPAARPATRALRPARRRAAPAPALLVLPAPAPGMCPARYVRADGVRRALTDARSHSGGPARHTRTAACPPVCGLDTCAACRHSRARHAPCPSALSVLPALAGCDARHRTRGRAPAVRPGARAPRPAGRRAAPTPAPLVLTPAPHAPCPSALSVLPALAGGDARHRTRGRAPAARPAARASRPAGRRAAPMPAPLAPRASAR